MKIIGPTSNPPEPKPATFGAPPPWERDPVATTEAPESAPSLMDHVQNYAALFDTSMPFYEMQKRAQRATTKTPAPSILGSSRAQRRASGDRRTVKQIMAEQRREGR